MERHEIRERLKQLGINNDKELMNVLKLPKRTIEKWFYSNGNFPSWFIHYLKQLEINKKLSSKIDFLERELQERELQEK